MPITDHLDFIRIRNLEDADSEVFEGIGGGVSTTPGGTAPGGTLPTPIDTPVSLPVEPVTPGGPPVTPAEKKAFDLKSAWTAQQALTGTLINFLSALEPGANTDAGNLVTDYIRLLEATKGFSASLDAFGINRDALAELPMIWATLNRQPSKELTNWIKDADTWGKSLETWFKDGIGALYDRDAAQADIDAANALLASAQTEEEVAAANAALTAANAKMTAASGEMAAAAGELPGNAASPIPGLVELITIARAMMTGDFVLVGIVLIRIAVPLGIDWLVKWIGGKLPGKKPTEQDVQPIVDALRDLALKDTRIRFGDHFEIYEKAEILQY